MQTDMLLLDAAKVFRTVLHISLCILLCWRIPKCEANLVLSVFLDYRSHTEIAVITLLSCKCTPPQLEWYRKTTARETFTYMGDTWRYFQFVRIINIPVQTDKRQIFLEKNTKFCSTIFPWFWKYMPLYCRLNCKNIKTHCFKQNISASNRSTYYKYWFQTRSLQSRELLKPLPT